MKDLVRSLIILPLAIASGCMDGNTGASNEAPPLGTQISNPSFLVASGSNGSITVSGSNDGVVWLSLEPGTLPTAVKIQIYNNTHRGPATLVTVKDGGFDPVPISAKADDVIRMDVVLAGGIVRPMSIRVPARRNPRVVRTNPSKGRIDVALNVTVIVVFTEPVNPRTVTESSLNLLRDGRPVPAIVTVASNGLTAQLTPTNPLAPNSNYDVEVSQDVRDLDGDALDAEWETSFTTGTVATGGCPGYAIPTQCPPFPTGGPYWVDGVVMEHKVDGDVPYPNPSVFAWVQRSNSGYQRGVTSGDAQGRFHVDNLPNAQVTFTVLSLLDQPCATVVKTGGPPYAANIELISPDTPMPERATTTPQLTGIVYETVNGARQPVAGARVYFDAAMDLIVAWTTTDADGRYSMCNLPAIWSVQTVYVSSPEFLLRDQTVSITPGVTELDIELSR